MEALDAHESQVYEWLPWIDGYLDKVPAKNQDRKKWLAGIWEVKITPEVRTALQKWYGKDTGAAAAHAEAFEICEYGKRPTDDDIKRLFPMLK